MDSLPEDAGSGPLAVLSRFRRDFHACLTARADELCELADAVPCADGPVRNWPVGADNVVTSRDLRMLVDQAAQPIASSDAYVVAGGCAVGSAVGRFLAEGPVRPWVL